MFDSLTVVAVICLYMGFLLVVAWWWERRVERGGSFINSSVIYSFALAVYCTTWTYYGSVGSAATSGFLFLTIYLGPTLAIALWWTVLRKLVRIKTAHRITSIADLISARYNRSPSLAALVTVIAFVGITPYVALQFRAINSTIAMIILDGGDVGSGIGRLGGALVAGALVLFTVVLGIRRLDPTERHPGMMIALAVESFVKLFAFLAAGIFVTYFMYDGLGDIFQRLAAGPAIVDSELGALAEVSPLKWTAYLVLAMSAILFLPRQFHVAVVENVDEKHIKTAMWLFPLYMFLINFFTFPIAIGGLLQGQPIGEADTFVLGLPLHAGWKWLSLFVFIGGFSAATAMIMVSSIAMATMITNHLLLPVIGWFKPLGFLRRRLLICRWVAVAGFIMIGYWSDRAVAQPYMLLNIGIISFAAVVQFAPAILGGIFWRRGNEAGALLGLIAGFLTWAYTLLLPALIRSGWFSITLLDVGPWGIGWLNPEQLFGIVKLDPVTHTVFWSLLFNILLYVGASLCFEQREEERSRVEQFVGILGRTPILSPAGRTEPKIDLQGKRKLIVDMLTQFFPRNKAVTMIDQCISVLALQGKSRISIRELAELQGQIEKTLTGSIGVAQAHKAIQETAIFSPDEARELSEVYAEILASLRVTPDDLKRRVDYYREKERLLGEHAADLEERIREREEEIRQRKVAEEGLTKAEEKYRSIFENAVEGIFQSTPEGRFLSVNMALARMLGYASPDELIEEVTDIKRQLYVNPEQREDLVRLVEQEEMVYDFETQQFRKDGSKIWVSTRARPVRDEHGKLLYLEGTFQDISARKKAEADRTALEEQLRQSQKMEAIGTLASGIAHDFNNLLQVILGRADMLLLNKSFGIPASRSLEAIRQAARSGGDLVNRILTFTRKVETAPRPLDLNQEVRHAKTILRRTIPKMVEIETRLTEGIRTINADPGQIEQILLNLAVNAKDAMPDGGKLVFVTRDVFLDGDYYKTHFDCEPGDYVMLMVSDSGGGMSQEVLERIFEPFYTTKDPGEGTGLGLAMVFGIVQAHHGHITCHSELGGGTVFRIYFPAVAEEASAATAATVKMPTFGTETILLVDDDNAVRDLAKEILEWAGYKVFTAGNGLEGLEVYRKRCPEISLVILDLIMPEMGGRRCLEEILKIDPEARILIASGFSADGATKDAVEAGAGGFIGKPYDAKEILRTIRRVLDDV